ncbi:MAG: winged helix-turn-helix domain-containing protein [Acidobacteria bacterium]|nr:winged helix-turn-helix domain-containing protein [Acidobacteriota bacterium]
MKSNGEEDQNLQFGLFELKLKSEELFSDGAPVKLPPQPFKVLAFLAIRAGQLVTREELQQEIWGADTFVDFDKGLNFCIKQIREALGDNAQTPQFIETLPRRGYRFIAPVEKIAVSSEVALPQTASLQQPDATEQSFEARTSGLTKRPLHWFALAFAAVAALALAGYVWRQRAASPAKPATGKIMLAVLPFENLNADATQDYFSDGLTEEMITQLGRLRPQQLGVIARTTALTYKQTKKDIRQIGQELGVAYVLEGSVRREAGRVRITAQLIQVSDQTHLWAETFDRQQSDMLQIQSEVASRVARSLALELLSTSPANALARKTSQPDAYDAYLKGRYLIIKDTLEDFERSIPFFEQAIAKDPNFAPAYVGLVESYLMMATWRNTPAGEILPKAKPAALKAVELDPSLAEAYSALGSVNFWLEWNWPEAEANFKRAIELNPSNPHIHLHYASYLSTQGQIEAGVEQVKQALQLDPVSLLTNGLAAFFYLRARRFDDAITQARIMLEIEPSSPSAYYCLSSAYTYKGMYREAVETARQQMRKHGEKEETIKARTSGDPHDVILKNRQENLNWMKEAMAKGERVSASYLASVYAELGETDHAFESLEKSFAMREPSFVYFKIHPGYDNLHTDPRFTQLAQRMGLSH